MKKHEQPDDQAMIDALLARRDPNASARLSEWAGILTPPEGEIQRARRAHERVARGVARRLEESASSEASVPRRASRVYPWRGALTAAACLTIVLSAALLLDGRTDGSPVAPSATDTAPVTASLPSTTDLVPVASAPIRTESALGTELQNLPRNQTLIVASGRLDSPLRIDRPLRIVGVPPSSVVD